MFFHIVNADNQPVLSGKLVLMCPHTTASETQKNQVFLVYMHEVQIDESKFQDWSTKHLIKNRALGSGGKEATSEFDYIEFTLGKFRDDYSFNVSESRHRFK